MLAKDKNYILFDEDCQFCIYWVNWIFKRDHTDQFLFATIKSPIAETFLRERGLIGKQNHMLYLWRPQRFYYVKSEAILEAAKILGGTAGIFASANIFPRFFSDIVFEKMQKQISGQKKEHLMGMLTQSGKYIE